MSKLGLAIVPMPGGVGLVVQRENESDLFVPMPMDRASAFLMDWWRAYSALYPGVRNPDPDADTYPVMMVTGDARVQASAKSDGLVHLQTQPNGFAGVTYELTPEQARTLAEDLVTIADAVEAFSSPN